MANYTNMLKDKKERSETMMNLALLTISEMLEDGEKVTVADLVKRTGFSRDYFYKNATVHQAYENAVSLQTGRVFVNKKEDSLLKATRRENELLKKQKFFLEQRIFDLESQVRRMNVTEFELVSNL